MSEKLQKPGEVPHKPGEFLEVGPQGGKVKDARQVTVEPEDSPLPPTQESGRRWKHIGRPKP